MATPAQEHSQYLKWFNVIAAEAPVTNALPAADDYIQAIAIRDGLKFRHDTTQSGLPLTSTALQSALTALKA
jgi:hypothetical protein